MLTPEEKIALFQSLFRGREDVFAVRWESSRGSGYKPIHSPFGPEVVRGHLLGEIEVGVYPLLPDNTTFFLAIDCDGSSAGRDSQALAEQCRARDLPTYLERSRSGEGFHLWFFFAGPIAAGKARAFGFHIVKSAEVELRSLDRFFPSQDSHTGPKGLGNLIALPLQKKARAKQNSVFVDPTNLQAFPEHDQWDLLEDVKRLSEEDLDLILSEPSDVIYAPLPLLKFTRPGPSKPSVESGPLKIWLAEHIEVSLPCSPALLSFLRSISQFHNPIWFRKNQQGQYLGDTPRFIRCGGRVGDVWVAARGLWGELRNFLEDTKTLYVLNDKRTSPLPISDWKNSYQLRPDQLLVVHRVLSLKGDDTVLEAPTGTGKTIISLELVVRRGLPALILVPSRALLEQWLERLDSAMNIPKAQVGLIRRGKLTLGERVTVATLQSLVHRDLEELANHCGHVIVDECHRAPAKTFAAVLRQLKPRHFLGLTATPRRKDQLQRLIFAYLGQRTKSSTPKELDRQSIIVLPRFVYHNTDFEHAGAPIQKILSDVSRDTARNHRIAKDVIGSVEEGHLVLILSDRKEHCDLLHDALQSEVGVAVIYGKVGKKARKKIFMEFEQGLVRVLISTAKLLGEGWDCPPLSALFLSFPMGGSPRLEQLIGRLTRPAPDKPSPVVHDYLDHKVPVLSAMFQRRLKVFRRLLGEERLPPDLQSKARNQRANLHYGPVKSQGKPRTDRVQETGQLFLFE